MHHNEKHGVNGSAVQAGGDFADAPFLVIWEITQSCDLACLHCRASAQPEPDPDELTTAEGMRVINEVSAMGTRILVLTGGDPLKRSDLYTLIAEGKRAGLRMGAIPAATPLLTREVVAKLKDAGLDQMALSLDYPRAELHDGFRQVSGTFEKTIDAAGWAREYGLALQINTVITADSAPHIPELADLVERLGTVFWEVFFLVPTGRGEAMKGLSPRACEDAFAMLYEIQKRNPFILKVAEAPHYRRYVAQRVEREADGQAAPSPADVRVLPKPLTRPAGPRGSVGLAPYAVNAGKGFAFVSHTGDVYPSGFLPVTCGNVRKQNLAEIYRESEIFRILRNPDLLTGKCGRCEYRFMCGGSRSRAYAVAGDYRASEPWCAYQPGSEISEHA